jgi:hypothetical protein
MRNLTSKQKELACLIIMRRFINTNDQIKNILRNDSNRDEKFDQIVGNVFNRCEENVKANDINQVLSQSSEEYFNQNLHTEMLNLSEKDLVTFKFLNSTSQIKQDLFENLKDVKILEEDKNLSNNNNKSSPSNVVVNFLIGCVIGATFLAILFMIKNNSQGKNNKNKKKKN